MYIKELKILCICDDDLHNKVLKYFKSLSEFPSGVSSYSEIEDIDGYSSFIMKVSDFNKELKDIFKEIDLTGVYSIEIDSETF